LSPYGIGQTIIFSSCGFFLFLFPRLISAVADGCLPYFHTWCDLSANLRCRSETCCARLAANTGRKRSSKIRHLGTIAQLCRAISLQLRHMLTIGKKLVKQQYLLHMSSQHGELRPANGWDRCGSLGAPQQISTGFTPWHRYCSDVAQRKPTKLCTVFGRLVGCYSTVAWSVGLSVFLSVILVSLAKTAEPIEMSFGLWARMDPRNHVLDGAQIIRGKAQLLEESICPGMPVDTLPCAVQK